MASQQISDDLRYQFLKAIIQNPECSQRELADRIGISLGKTNYCLRTLVAAGLVIAGKTAYSGRALSYAYKLTPSGIEEMSAVTVRFLKKKQLQYEQLKCEIEALKKETENIK